VARISEAVELRQAGISAPIYLFGLPVPEEVDAILLNRVIPFVSSRQLVRLLSRQAARRGMLKCEVHLKIDTGMGRIGCSPEDALGLARYIRESPNLSLGGICTHLPNSDVSDSRLILRQIELLKSIAVLLRRHTIDPGLVHAANSGAAIGYPDSFLDMVRLGIALYGYYPSANQERTLPLRPVMQFMTKIVFL